MTSTVNAPAQEAARKIPNDQLDSLVAPIALYPDPLLAQILAASTYPLEVIELEQWLKRNPNLKDKALADGVAKQPWDPSIQAMAVFPGCGHPIVGKCRLDNKFGKRVSSATARRDGRGATHAGQGAEQWSVKDNRPTESGN
jgi:hypothetical protein